MILFWGIHENVDDEDCFQKNEIDDVDDENG